MNFLKKYIIFKHRKCQKVLGKNMELWENEVYRFKTIGQLKVCHPLSKQLY